MQGLELACDRGSYGESIQIYANDMKDFPLQAEEANNILASQSPMC